jgi:hypothetical protein
VYDEQNEQKMQVATATVPGIYSQKMRAVAEKINSLSPNSQMTLGLMITLATMLSGGIWQAATFSGKLERVEEKVVTIEANTVRKDVIYLELQSIKTNLETQNLRLEEIRQALKMIRK